MDLVGPTAPGALAHVQDLFDRIAAEAAEVDATGVRRSTIDELAALGLLGTALEPALQRELGERLAMADASTWFCWVQHQSPLRVLAGDAAGLRDPVPSALRDAYLDDLATGRALGATAFAHVRRPGPPDPSARRTPSGWVFDGSLDWVTSWDIADVVMVMAQGEGDDAGALVCTFLPAGRSGTTMPGVEPGEPLRLLAMSATHTRPVRLTGVEVPDEACVVIDREAWLRADARTTASATPAAFGVARGAIAELAGVAEQRRDTAMSDLAHDLADRCRRIRAAAYAGADADAPIEECRRLRAESLDMVMAAATSVITARAGAAMQAGCSAERRLREAAFLQVQAQTAATRAAAIELQLSRAR